MTRLIALPLLALAAALAALASPGGVPVADAAFDPTATLALSDDSPGAAADLTFELDVPEDDYAPHLTVLASPADAFVAPDNPLGTIAGTATIPANFALTNTPCASNFTLQFTLLNATVDKNTTIAPLPQSSVNPGGRLENLWQDNGGGAPTNGLPAQVDRYPTFLNTLFSTDSGTTLTPRARYAGGANMSGTILTLNVVVFDQGILGRLDSSNPLSDFSPDFGDVMVLVFNDPTAPQSKNIAVNDFCTPIQQSYIFYGKTRNTICMNGPSSSCDTPTEINSPAPTFNSTDRYTNPPGAGTYLWFAYQQSERDTDGDGTDNTLDTCPTVPDFLDHRDPFGDQTFDLDLDGIPGVCDNFTQNPGDSDEDNDGFLNRGDNCPVNSNASQSQAEHTGPWPTAAPRGGPKTDQIGDACDFNDEQADGRFYTTLALLPRCIGGTDADGDGWCALGSGGLPGDPSDTPGAGKSLTPETRAAVVDMPLAHSGSGVNPHVRGTPGVSTGLGIDQCDLASAGSSSYCFGFGSIANDGNSVNNNNPTTGAAAVAYSGTGEPYQLCNNGRDDDGDGLVDLLDPGCAPGSTGGVDTDGDGYSDLAEMYIGTDILGRCEVNGGGGTNTRQSTDWPSDLDSTTGFPLPSQDKITVTDITAFLVPKRLGTNPGDANYNPRFDLVPGQTFPFPHWIAVNDLTALLSGNSGFPPMFSGQKAFGGLIDCTAHPVYAD